MGAPTPAALPGYAAVSARPRLTRTAGGGTLENVGITFNHDDWDGLSDEINYFDTGAVEKAFARELADRARGLGLSTVDSLPLVDIEVDPNQRVDIDPDRIRALANQLLADARGSEASPE